jgi:hypothetical protein
VEGYKDNDRQNEHFNTINQRACWLIWRGPATGKRVGKVEGTELLHTNTFPPKRAPELRALSKVQELGESWGLKPSSYQAPSNKGPAIQEVGMKDECCPEC